MEFGLKDQVIHQIQDVLKKFPAVEKAVLYGSRAKGNYKNGSDIDLCLFGDIDLTLLFRIDDALDDLNLPYTFDLSSYQYISNQDLISHIERKGIIFFKRNIE